MAVDTAAKRVSVVHILKPWRGVAAFPDGTLAQGDRQALALLYSGILAGGAPVVTRRTHRRLLMRVGR